MDEVREVSAARLERPMICVLALSAIADDPRVRRQAEAFHRAGWKVTAVGLPGARSAAPEWRILTAENFPMPRVKASGCSVTPAAHPGRPILPKALRLVGRLAYRLPRALGRVPRGQSVSVRGTAPFCRVAAEGPVPAGVRVFRRGLRQCDPTSHLRNGRARRYRVAAPTN